MDNLTPSEFITELLGLNILTGMQARLIDERFAAQFDFGSTDQPVRETVLTIDDRILALRGTDPKKGPTALEIIRALDKQGFEVTTSYVTALLKKRGIPSIRTRPSGRITQDIVEGWLTAVHSGMSYRQLMLDTGVSEKTIRDYVEGARRVISV